MDDGEPRTATGTPVGEASDPPTALVLALWVPVTAVVAWFMVRLFAGRWVNEPEAPPFPVRGRGGEGPGPEGPERHDGG